MNKNRQRNIEKQHKKDDLDKNKYVGQKITEKNEKTVEKFRTD